MCFMYRMKPFIRYFLDNLLIEKYSYIHSVDLLSVADELTPAEPVTKHSIQTGRIVSWFAGEACNVCQ